MTSTLRVGQASRLPPWPFALEYSNAGKMFGGAGETPALLSASPRCVVLLFLTAVVACAQAAGTPPALRPIVEAEEDIYSYTNADNGAGPLWCHGSTCLVRIGDEVFASGLETLTNIKPLNNCRWTLYQRGKRGWQLQQVDETGRTR